MKRGIIPVASLTPEEAAWIRSARTSAQERRWDEAFLDFQRLLASLRDRGNSLTERKLLVEFSDLLRSAGDHDRADRVLRYLEAGFTPN